MKKPFRAPIVPGVRLPVLPYPVAALAPPVPAVVQQPPVTNADFEGASVSALLSWSVVNSEVSIYSTSQPRRACDVFLSPPPGAPIGDERYFRVRVYAISRQSGRTLVASGYYSNADARDPVNPRRWVAAARCATAEIFEVTATAIGQAGATPTNPTVTVVASDCDSPAPDAVGVALMLPGGVLGAATVMPRAGAPPATSDPGFQTQIYAASIVNTTAAVLYWQAIDAVSVGGAAGAVPMICVPVPANGAVQLGPDVFRGLRFGANGLVVGGSSTAGTYTGAAGLLQQVWCK